MKKLWKCPKCKREFAKTNQQHSCKIYPIENHFKNKAYARELYEFLVKNIQKIGPLKIESKKVYKFIKMSPNRYLYYLDILKKEEIDSELLDWIKRAYKLNIK